MDELLKLLRDDASLTPAQIAGRLNLAEAEVEMKIKELETKGIILGYRTVINEEKLDVDIVRAVIEVKITPEREGGFDRLATRIARFDEVQSCYLMSGGYDLMVVVEGTDLKY
ncbi:MAG: Lrp/AsnC family transcriptional regulator, partial [Verrucomicrobiia bacterium]